MGMTGAPFGEMVLFQLKTRIHFFFSNASRVDLILPIASKTLSGKETCKNLNRCGS